MASKPSGPTQDEDPQIKVGNTQNVRIWERPPRKKSLWQLAEKA